MGAPSIDEDREQRLADAEHHGRLRTGPDAPMQQPGMRGAWEKVFRNRPVVEQHAREVRAYERALGEARAERDRAIETAVQQRALAQRALQKEREAVASVVAAHARRERVLIMVTDLAERAARKEVPLPRGVHRLAPLRRRARERREQQVESQTQTSLSVAWAQGVVDVALPAYRRAMEPVERAERALEAAEAGVWIAHRPVEIGPRPSWPQP